MLDGTHMKFQCKTSGQYWENSKVVRRDMISGNGVVHMINKLQLPNSGMYIHRYTYRSIVRYTFSCVCNKFLVKI